VGRVRRRRCSPLSFWVQPLTVLFFVYKCQPSVVIEDPMLQHSCPHPAMRATWSRDPMFQPSSPAMRATFMPTPPTPQSSESNLAEIRSMIRCSNVHTTSNASNSHVHTTNNPSSESNLAEIRCSNLHVHTNNAPAMRATIMPTPTPQQ
jgi:hypothetical protein